MCTGINYYIYIYLNQINSLKKLNFVITNFKILFVFFKALSLDPDPHPDPNGEKLGPGSGPAPQH